VAHEWWDVGGEFPKPPSRAPERVWTLRNDPHEKSCVVVFRGEAYGWELRIDVDGVLEHAQRFEVKAVAVTFANEWREASLAAGWCPIEATP
jgi:hypothetical protein